MHRETYLTAASIRHQAARWIELPEISRSRHEMLVLDPARLLVIFIDLQVQFFSASSPAFLPSSRAILPGLAALFHAAGVHRIPVLLTRHVDPADSPMVGWWGRAMSGNDAVSEICEPFREIYNSAADIEARDIGSRDTVSPPVTWRLVKSTYDIFQGTSLDEQLKSRGITQLLVAGAVAHLCVSTSVRSAFTRGYEVFIPVDGIVAPNREVHLNTLKSLCHCCAVPLTLDRVNARLEEQGMKTDAPSGASFSSRPIHTSGSPLSSTPPHTSGSQVSSRSLRASASLPQSPDSVLHEDSSCGLPEIRGNLDCAVIGAGPAGITAAVQLAREGMNIGLFDSNAPGGLIRNARKIDNMPALPDGLPGIECASILYDRLVHWNIPYSRSLVTKVDIDAGGNFIISTVPVRSGARLSPTPTKCAFPTATKYTHDRDREPDVTARSARSVILATGTRSRSLPQGWRSDRLFTEYWPLRRITGGRIAVIGGGDIAFDYALHCAGRNRVDLIYRGSSPRALPLLRIEVEKTATIDEHTCEEVTVTGRFIMKKNRDPEENNLKIGPFDAILAAIGRVPERSSLREEWRRAMDDAPDPLYPNVHPGFFAAGDCIRGNRRQVAIAMGDGMLAAMMATAFLT